MYNRQHETQWLSLPSEGFHRCNSHGGNVKNSSMWNSWDVCVYLHMCTCLCVCACTVMVIMEVGVASLRGTRSREQVGSGWSRESVLIVFVPQSCLAVVKAASTSWEANCSIYTRRRFPFLSFFYFFYYYYFTMGDVATTYCVRWCSCWFSPIPGNTTKLQCSSDEKAKATNSWQQ